MAGSAACALRYPAYFTCGPPHSDAPPVMLTPTDIQAIGDEIAIRWSDGSENYYPMERLRAWSPSAETAGERDLLGHKIGGDDRTDFPGVRATAWQIVGGYAVAFAFSDGHKTGLYGFDYLKAIGRKLGQQ